MITLSEKVISDGVGSYYHKDLRKFIKDLKSESICKDCSVGYDVGCDCEDHVFLLNTREIDRLAGDALCTKDEGVKIE